MDNVWLNPDFANSAPPTAVFADRDGTLIEHIDYVSDPDKIKLLPGVKESVHRLIKANIPFFILTNQSGVGRGYFPIKHVHACQRRLFDLLGIRPEDTAGWCIAPEAPGENGGYRKPSTRFLDEACALLGTPAASCHVIGDTLVDLQTAWNAGARAWAVGCGKPQLPAAHRAREIVGTYDFQPDFAACIRSITSQR